LISPLPYFLFFISLLFDIEILEAAAGTAAGTASAVGASGAGASLGGGRC
jgi:hypothetical protein